MQIEDNGNATESDQVWLVLSLWEVNLKEYEKNTMKSKSTNENFSNIWFANLIKRFQWMLQ